ncbi:MAG: hypothetical protein CMN32_05465 [Saprospirales bacterium]|nr:hypothetical protein [Saprospirales bacterium]
MKFATYTLVLSALVVLASCTKGDLTKEDFDKQFLTIVSDGDDAKGACLELVYPVNYLMPDGSVIAMNHADDWSAIKAWYEAHPDVKAKPELQYPLEITSVKFDGVQVVSNEEEMLEWKKLCDWESDVKLCDWDGVKVSDQAVWEEVVVEPLVYKDDCGACPVSGEIKYVKGDSDFAYIVNYGDGACDHWGWLITWYGNTSDKKPEKCKFKLDCE